MILSDRDIKAAIKEGRIRIDPVPEDDQYSPTALDLRLGMGFERWNEELLATNGVQITIDPSAPGFSVRKLKSKLFRSVTTGLDGSFLLKPGDMVLGITRERIELPLESQIAARVEGRSSLARLGLSVHITAPTIHAGFRGAITLEIKNHGSATIKLMPEKLPVCQLIFESVLSVPETALTSEFQDQSFPLGGQKNLGGQ